ncbi:MAG: hypothetical protein J1F40_06165 [Prevotellaceae bacterium]|nr:hypothetical protein [Prevotellaceae bacterium]
MKRFSLLLASVMLATVSVLAQPKKPTPPDMTYVSWADAVANQTPVALYNVEAGLFLTSGNDWGSRASLVSNTRAGINWTNSNTFDDLLSGNGTVIGAISWTIQEVADKQTVGNEEITCHIINNTGNGKSLFFADGDIDAIFVDNTYANDKWFVNDLGGNTFQLSYIWDDAKPKGWFGAQLLDIGNTRVYIREGDYTTWALVASADVTDDIKSGCLLYQHQKGVYTVQLELYNAIAAAKKAGAPAADLAEYEAIATADLATTVDGLAKQKAETSAAMPKVAEIAKDYASLDNPSDITSAIPYVADGTLDLKAWSNADLNTWSGEMDGTNMVTPFLQNWVGAGGILTDNKFYRDYAKEPFTVKPGAYRISANVRIYNEAEGGEYVTGAYLFSNLNRTNLVKPDIEGQENAIEGAAYGTYQTVKLWYWKDGFETYTIVPNDGILKFGVQIEEANFNWLAAKGWKVEYLGAAYDAIDYVRKNTEFSVDDFDFAGVDYVTKALKEDYDKSEQYIATYNTSSNAEDILAAYTALFSTREQLPVNVAAWKAYSALAEQILDDDVLLAVGDEVQLLNAYLNNDDEPNDEFANGTYKYIIDNLALTTAELEAETKWLDELYTNAIKNSMTPGQDVSNMLKNASFKDGFEGWTTKNGTRGGLKAFPAVEVYQDKVDVYQIVEDVPDGIYSITCRAFERPTWNGGYSGEEESKVYLYMNDFRTPVQSIAKGKIANADAEDLTNSLLVDAWDRGSAVGEYWDTNGWGGRDAGLTFNPNAEDTERFPNGKYDEVAAEDYATAEYYVPNGMVGASIAFRAGRYEQKVYGLVEGGTMKVGLISDGYEPAGDGHWVLWSDFKLTYEGKTVESLTALIDIIVQRAKDFQGTQIKEETMTAAAYDALSIAAATAELAKGKKDVDEMWNAIIALNKAIDEAKAHPAIFAEYNEAMDAFYLAYEEIDNPTAAQEAVYEDIEGKAAGVSKMLNADLKAFIEEIKIAAAKLRLPDYDSATDEAPVNMNNVIVNRSFEEGDLNGWTATPSGDTGAKEMYDADGNKTVYYVDLSVEQDAGDFVFNTWVDNPAVAGGYYLEQTVLALPEGTYELKAILASDANNTITLAANKYKVPYIIPEVEVADEPEAVDEDADEDAEDEEPALEPKNIGIEAINVFKLKENEPLVIRVESDTWFKADNFRLSYFGKNSKQTPTEIEAVESADGAASSTPVAIYTLAGTKVSSLQKGINIVKYANGKVAKVLVK